MSHPKMSGLPVPPTHPNSTGEEVEWHELPWKRFEQVVFRLQKRIYQAKKRGEERTARKLQTLLIKSRSARFLAVRRVSQLNSGKKTAGIDGKANLTYQERYQLVDRLTLAAEWNHQGLREVPIPKADGTQRILKIPTLQDRAWQILIAMALEPRAEATFHARAYGFRLGRSCWDAQKGIWLNTHRGPSGKKFSGKIYELDIKACCDRIDRQDLIKRVELPKSYKGSIWRALQAGTNPEYPDQGAPQGGPLSPLLANIALNDIETLGHGIRYADDMVFIIKRGEDIETLRANIDAFLAIRGLEIKPEKSRVVEMAQGFDFLGFTFKKLKNGTSRSYPTAASFKKLRNEVRNILKSPLSDKSKAEVIAPKIRGWLTYYRYTNMASIRGRFWKLDNQIYQKLGAKWINLAFPKIPWKANGHSNVSENRSPYDGEWVYWANRNSAKYTGLRARLLKLQSGRCVACGHYFRDTDEIHLHHLNGKREDTRITNLMRIHRSCHQIEHSRRYAERRNYR